MQNNVIWNTVVDVYLKSLQAILVNFTISHLLNGAGLMTFCSYLIENMNHFSCLHLWQYMVIGSSLLETFAKLAAWFV